MKSNNIVIGGILIVVGILVLASNLDIFHLNWEIVSRLWPAIILFIGIRSFFPNAYGLLISLLLTTIIVVGVGYVATVTGQLDPRDFLTTTQTGNHQQFTVENNESIQTASLKIESGAGDISLSSGTDTLMTAEATSTIGAYTLDQDLTTTNADLRLHIDNPNIQLGPQNHTLDVKLNSNPAWRIDANIGAAQGRFDFSDLQIEQLTLKSGATDVNLRLGSIAKEAQVTIETGASSTDIEVPQIAGVQITTDTGLTDNEFNGFTQVNEKTYQSDNFESAEKKIFIHIKAGMSSITVNRY
ncbi:hypothetical protein HGA91_03950 [candidate division WWE3 bacterium]|nr:hypothetical protein [candidate division WWE3 bacterium]